MKIAMFSTKKYDQTFFSSQNSEFDIRYIPARFNSETALLASECDAVCCFVNDRLDAEAITQLSKLNIKLIALRCAGFNNVDIETCKALNIAVCRVPEYSPYAVAEHAVALILDLNRNIHRAFNRVRENDYSLDGLMGFDLHGKTVGVIGAGKIGRAFIQIMQGFGCHVNVFDPYTKLELPKVRNVSMEELLANSDILSLHCPLTTETYHLINDQTLALTKQGVMIINTSRGGLIDTRAVIRFLKKRHIGYLGLDVYEEEGNFFFEDLSDTLNEDDVFARLQTFPNVTITSHQGFFTYEALYKIAEVTLSNIKNFQQGKLDLVHLVV